MLEKRDWEEENDQAKSRQAESDVLGFVFLLKHTLWQGPQMSALSKTLAGDLAMENTEHNNVTRVEGVH